MSCAPTTKLAKIPSGMLMKKIHSQQSLQIGFNEIFHLLGIIFLCVIAFVWIAKPPFGAKAGAPAGGGH